MTSHLFASKVERAVMTYYLCGNLPKLLHRHYPMVDSVYLRMCCPKIEKQLGFPNLPGLHDIRTDLFQRSMKVNAIRTKRFGIDFYVRAYHQFQFSRIPSDFPTHILDRLEHPWNRSERHTDNVPTVCLFSDAPHGSGREGSQVDGRVRLLDGLRSYIRSRDLVVRSFE